NGAPAVLVRANMLSAAVVGLQAGKTQRLRFHDRRRQTHRVARGLDAAAIAPDIELDQHVDVGAELFRCGRELRYVVHLVDAHAEPFRAARERGNALELRRADHFVADENVPDAAVDENLGFRDFLTAYPDGASLELQVGNGGALVRLGVRPHTDPGARDPLLHAADVALERVELDQ